MRGGRFRQQEEEVKPDLSPMIDCIFILLIFFIVTTVFVEEKGLDVKRPENTSQVSASDSNSVLIKISATNKITHEGNELQLGNVQSMVKEKLSEDEEMPVIIQGDTKASHGVVTRVYNQCVSAGATKLTTSTE